MMRRGGSVCRPEDGDKCGNAADLASKVLGDLSGQDIKDKDGLEVAFELALSVMHSVDGLCRGGVAGAEGTAEFVSNEADHPASGHVISEFLAGVVIFIHPVFGPFAAELLHERSGTDGVATREHFAEVREDGFAPLGDIATQGGEE